MKTLSIAMPIYNIEGYLPASLKSFLADDSIMACFEILMVDDGSTDGSPEICKQYASQYPDTFIYLPKANGHYGSAVNHAIDNARGRYFRIVDGDDCVDIDGLKGLCLYLEKHPELDMVLNDYEIRYLVTGKSDNVRFNIPANTVNRFNEIHFYSANMHAITYKTSILKDHDIRMDVGVAFTDYECSLYPMQFVDLYAYLPETLYIYSMERKGQSVDPELYMKTMPDHSFVLNSLIRWFDGLGVSECSEHFLDYAARRIADMANSHAVRCFKAKGDKEKLIDELAHLEHDMRERPLINKYFKGRRAISIGTTGRLGYSLVALAVNLRFKAENFLHR